MGMVASHRRLISLIARKTDLELQAQQLNQKRVQLANNTSNLFSSLTNLTPNSNSALQLQNQIASLQQVDKQFELELRRIEPQREAIQQELQGLQKIIEKTIEFNFKGLA
jgi:hypothetical protein